MRPNDPDPILDFNFNDNANASSMTNLAYNHDISPPRSPTAHQHEHTYTPQDDADIDAIRTVASSRPTLHNLRIPTSSIAAVPENASSSDSRGEYKAFVPMAAQKQKRKSNPVVLTEIYAGSKSNFQSEKREGATRKDHNPGPDQLKLQKEIRNLLALVVALLVIVIIMLIPLLYFAARTWIFATSNVSAFTADGRGISRGLPGLVSDIVQRAANGTRTELGQPINSLGSWTKDMNGWTNATSARLSGMDAGGLNGMVKNAVSGVDGVNKKLTGLLDKLVVVGVNGTGEIWER